MSNDISRAVFTDDGRPAGTPHVNEMERQFSQKRYTFMLTQFPHFYKNQLVYSPGCGWGAGEQYIRSLGAKYVYGNDFNEEAIQIANENFAIEGQLDFVTENITETKCEDAHFEKIVAVEIVEHVTDEELDLVLKDWNRVLKLGGDLYITTPERRHPKEDFPKGSHFTEYDFDELIGIVQKYGFDFYWGITQPVTGEASMALLFKKVLDWQDVEKTQTT